MKARLERLGNALFAEHGLFGEFGPLNIRWKIYLWLSHIEDRWNEKLNRQYDEDFPKYKEQLKQEFVVLSLLAKGFKLDDCWLYEKHWDKSKQKYFPSLRVKFDATARYSAPEKELPEGFYVYYEGRLIKENKEYITFRVFDTPKSEGSFFGTTDSGEAFQAPIEALSSLDQALMVEVARWIEIHLASKRWSDEMSQKRLERFERFSKALAAKAVPIEVA